MAVQRARVAGVEGNSENMNTTNTNSSSPGIMKADRILSLDALRGFDMFWILGADSLGAALTKISDNRITQAFANQLDHAEWEGFRFYDMIFPLFVFIMGVSTVLSLGKIVERDGKASALGRVFKRGLLIFVVGLIYSGGLANPWPDMRLMGVLNRIALCYTFGGIVFIYCNPKAMLGIAVALLLGYWALLGWAPFPDVRPVPGDGSVITKGSYKDVSQLKMDSTNILHGSYVQGVNIVNYFDQRFLPGRKYDGTYDPEGILSTIPAFATGLLGIFAGLLLVNKSTSPHQKVRWMIGAGVVMVVVGYVWGMNFPIIKKLWTSSYVLVAGGYSSILLGIFYWVVDVQKWQKWCQPFIWIGMNPITLYLASNFMGGLGFEKLATRLAGGSVKNYLNNHLTSGFGDLILSLVGVMLFIFFARFLYQRKIFLRL